MSFTHRLTAFVEAVVCPLHSLQQIECLLRFGNLNKPSRNDISLVFSARINPDDSFQNSLSRQRNNIPHPHPGPTPRLPIPLSPYPSTDRSADLIDPSPVCSIDRGIDGCSTSAWLVDRIGRPTTRSPESPTDRPIDRMIDRSIDRLVDGPNSSISRSANRWYRSNDYI
jgi:hypothetical protein